MRQEQTSIKAEAVVRKAFDEMNGTGDGVRAPYQAVSEWLGTQKLDDLKQKLLEAETMFRRTGITFAVYGSEEAAERLIPFDIIPRIISAAEWRRLTAGIEQRVRALNAFMYDIYHRQEIIKAGKVPEELIVGNSAFVPEMMGVEPPLGIYSHIIGIDIVRTSENDFFVLEDNTRTPSGVSYMLENRETMMHMFPDLFAKNTRGAGRELSGAFAQDAGKRRAERARARADHRAADARPIQQRLLRALVPRRPDGRRAGRGPRPHRDGRRAAHEDDAGSAPVDVIYRRIDDDFLDPLVFRPDSVLGVPGLFDLYRSGRVTIVNAPGGGIADDKAIYSYIPEIIKFYTGRSPILQNVPTYNCRNPDELKYVLEHLPELVVKEVHGSGGYGMLVGPTASKAEIEAFRRKLEANASNYIAQPTLALSTCPTLVEAGVAPRHLDLRPFVLFGDEVRLTSGGLTRVALRDGSLVVNSSQGGGTKDTWVLQD